MTRNAFCGTWYLPTAESIMTDSQFSMRMFETALFLLSWSWM